MAELKTLKDLKKEFDEKNKGNTYDYEARWVLNGFIPNLRQEAIRDIKEIIKCPKLLSTNFKKDGELEIEAIIPTKDFDFWKDKIKSAEGNENMVKIVIKGEEALRIVELNDFIGAEEYIKWKNNITKEDLK